MKIFITATNTNIGKTFATLLLIEKFLKKGLKVGVFKPFESGGREDSKKLLSASKRDDLSLDDINPYHFLLPASPYVAKEDKSIDFEKVKRAFKKIVKNSDIVLVEGAGGLMVPVEKEFFMIDLIEFLGIDKTLLITSNKLGSINDTMLSIKALKDKKSSFLWAVNQHENSKNEFMKITYPFYKDIFEEILFLEEDLGEIAKQLLSKHPL